jgi:hypothetical protein
MATSSRRTENVCLVGIVIRRAVTQNLLKLFIQNTICWAREDLCVRSAALCPSTSPQQLIIHKHKRKK